MRQRLGQSLLLVGLLATAGVLLWGWREGVFALSQTGPAVGLGRAFFAILYLPLALSLVVLGIILTGRGRVAPRWLRVVAAFFALVALGFVLMGVAGNLTYYAGRDVYRVLLQNLILASPLLLLSGLLFVAGKVNLGDG